MPEAVGQLNMYLNYYENEVNDEGDNKPIGIILCTDKDAIAAEYALGGLSTNIFASKYTYIFFVTTTHVEVITLLQKDKWWV